MLFCCGALWAVTAATPLCGQIRIVPRAKLDSLAHPATADGAQAMRFERTQIDAGHIGEDDTPPSYTFKWHNEGTAPLVITRGRPPAAAPRPPTAGSPSARAAKAR